MCLYIPKLVRLEGKDILVLSVTEGPNPTLDVIRSLFAPFHSSTLLWISSGPSSTRILKVNNCHWIINAPVGRKCGFSDTLTVLEPTWITFLTSPIESNVPPLDVNWIELQVPLFDLHKISSHFKVVKLTVRDYSKIKLSFTFFIA